MRREDDWQIVVRTGVGEGNEQCLPSKPKRFLENSRAKSDTKGLGAIPLLAVLPEALILCVKGPLGIVQQMANIEFRVDFRKGAQCAFNL